MVFVWVIPSTIHLKYKFMSVPSVASDTWLIRVTPPLHSQICQNHCQCHSGPPLQVPGLAHRPGGATDRAAGRGSWPWGDVGWGRGHQGRSSSSPWGCQWEAVHHLHHHQRCTVLCEYNTHKMSKCPNEQLTEANLPSVSFRVYVSKSSQPIRLCTGKLTIEANPSEFGVLWPHS